MQRYSATVRITLGLVCLTSSIVLAAQTLGVIPDRHAAVLDGRKALCESVAINGSLLMAQDRQSELHSALQAIVRRNDDLVSAAIVRNNELLVEVGPHRRHWLAPEEQESGSHVQVPITSGEGSWGRVEMRFRDSRHVAGWMRFLFSPLTRLVCFVSVVSMAVFFVYLRRMLSHLDPTKVVPERVRQALDTFAEGLLVLDKDERVVLANLAFAETVGRTPDELTGHRAVDFAWRFSNGSPTDRQFPWTQSMSDKQSRKGIMMALRTTDAHERTFMVSSAPILTERGESRGALVSLEDVTAMEKQRAELQSTLDALSRSRDEIRRQNAELEILATLDPLTGCLNRRSFFAKFEQLWAEAELDQRPLSCLMVDIDHFKSINDKHGHARGDQVLQTVGMILRADREDDDLVCRYGGEEFCVVLPDHTIEQADAAAEHLRKAIEKLGLGNLHLTASFGVSARNQGGKELQAMLEQADKCLYVAKRCGRNQVVRWDLVPPDLLTDESKPSRSAPVEHGEHHEGISFHAVTALISSLSFRDAETAEHSRRVADLCVALAEKHMPISDVYTLEIAALLHDIGKIGVADSILLKPGPLDDDEWTVMRAQEQVGVEILRSTFANDQLAELVEMHHAHYTGRQDYPDLPQGEDIPLGARIMMIADAFDSMTSNRVYRTALSTAEAFAELRRCGGQQFDPLLVEEFIEIVTVRGQQELVQAPLANKATALKIGLQIERLARALDNRDMFGLKHLAQRLAATARQSGLDSIADQAAELEQLTDQEPELVELIEVTRELFDLCRATQSVFLAQNS